MRGPFITRRTLGEVVEDAWANGYVIATHVWRTVKTVVTGGLR